jgi:hypothetical protein
MYAMYTYVHYVQHATPQEEAAAEEAAAGEAGV